MRCPRDWYLGTADAIYQNIYTLDRERPDLTVILSGDHIYKMNYRAMIDAHLAKKAHLTIACIPVPVDQAAQFGIDVIDQNHTELAQIFELPAPCWHKVIVEKRATFACSAGVRRPDQETGLRNFYLAGDYTAGDYPATIEGAVRSGIRCAKLVASTRVVH